MEAEYHQICLCYEGTERCSVLLAILQNGLEQVGTLIPWISGYSILKPPLNGNRIKMCKPLDIKNRLAVAIRVATKPDWPTLVRSDFSVRFFEEGLITPCSSARMQSKPPVFLAQLNAIHGGMMLVFCAETSAIDFSGLCFILDILNRACLGQQIPPEDIQFANRLQTRAPQDRYKLFPPTTPSLKSKEEWIYFKLDQLELGSMAHRVPVAVAATAFLLKSIAEARMLNEKDRILLVRVDTDDVKTIGVNASQIMFKPLSDIVKIVDTQDQLPKTVQHTQLRPNHDLVVHNWFECAAYGWTFGLGLNTPKQVVRPTFSPAEGTAYILPSLDKQVSLALCMAQEDLARFTGTEAFRRYSHVQ